MNKTVPYEKRKNALDLTEKRQQVVRQIILPFPFTLTTGIENSEVHVWRDAPQV